MGIIDAHASSTHCHKSNKRIFINDTPRVNAATTHTFLCRWEEMGPEGGLNSYASFIIILIDRFPVTDFLYIHAAYSIYFQLVLHTDDMV
jgi:hypothetical protein